MEKHFSFFSLLFVALTLGITNAHLFELPNKIQMAREDYFTVQQIYRGWAIIGAILIFGSLLSVLILTVLMRKDSMMFTYCLIALICLIAAQVVFWVYTFPANQATRNWTFSPENWEMLRKQWEYSHAVGALLTLCGFISLIWSVTFSNGMRRKFGN